MKPKVCPECGRRLGGDTIMGRKILLCINLRCEMFGLTIWRASK